MQAGKLRSAQGTECLDARSSPAALQNHVPSDNSVGRVRQADSSRRDGVVEARATDKRRAMEVPLSPWDAGVAMNFTLPLGG